MEEGRWVLCDRFADSSWAYQGAGRGLDRETVRRIEAVAIGDFKPDLTFVLDLPAEEGLKRANARASTESRFEQFDIGFHERLRQAFLDIAKRAPDRCRVIDASADENTVAQAIWKAAAARFALS